MAFTGTLYFLAVFDRSLTTAERADLRQAYLSTVGRSPAFPPVQLVVEGDSLSEEAFETEYLHWLHLEPRWKGRFTKRNIARFGETTAQMLAEFGTEVPKPGAGQNYLFLWAGRNDLPGSSATEIFSRLTTYWAKSRAQGYKVGAFTIIPAAYESEQLEVAARRRELNTLIRGAAADYDQLFDVDAVPSLSNPMDLTYFKPDGVHLTAQGSKAVADLIDSILAPGSSVPDL